MNKYYYNASDVELEEGQYLTPNQIARIKVTTIDRKDYYPIHDTNDSLSKDSMFKNEVEARKALLISINTDLYERYNDL